MASNSPKSQKLVVLLIALGGLFLIAFVFVSGRCSLVGSATAGEIVQGIVLAAVSIPIAISAARDQRLSAIARLLTMILVGAGSVVSLLAYVAAQMVPDDTLGMVLMLTAGAVGILWLVGLFVYALSKVKGNRQHHHLAAPRDG